MKVWTLKIQRNPMIPAAAMWWSPGNWWSPGIRWSPAIWWSPAIRWSIRSMDFDNRKVYGDTSITDSLVFSVIVTDSLPAGFTANSVSAWLRLGSLSCFCNPSLSISDCILVRHTFRWYRFLIPCVVLYSEVKIIIWNRLNVNLFQSQFSQTLRSSC